MTAAHDIATPGGDLVAFKGQMIARSDIPRSSRVRPVALENMDDALRYAKVLAASNMLPKSFYDVAGGDPTAMAFICIQLGAECGLSPMASVQNIAVINGKPGLYGPAMLAVVEASGMMETFEEWIEGEGDQMAAFCRVKRFGRAERTVRFGMDDARKANLSGKRGPWTEYPRRMLQARARSFALRDTFPDVLAGLAQGSVEELQDTPVDPPRQTIEATPEPAAAKAEKPPIEVLTGDGGPSEKFPRGKKGLRAALRCIVDAVLDKRPQVVGLNNQLLDDVATYIPELAQEVADIRAAAAEAMTPKQPDPNEPDDDEPDDDFPGDTPAKPEA